MNCKGMSVKINQKEMESLFNLKSILNHKEAASSYGDKYQELGWVLQAVDPQDGTDLEVDSGENPQAWVDRLWEPGLSAATINLGVATGKRSRLMVLEVTKGRGESILDQYGPWRAECIAALGARREQHFYAWAPSPLFDSAAFLDTPELRWFGEGQVVWCRLHLILKWGKPGSGCALPGRNRPNPPASLSLIFCSNTSDKSPRPGPRSTCPGRRFIVWCHPMSRCSGLCQLRVRRCRTIIKEFSGRRRRLA